MPKDPPARLVQDKAAQSVILRDEPRLIPEGFAGGRRNAAGDHIAHLALGMGREHLNRLQATHHQNCPSFIAIAYPTAPAINRPMITANPIFHTDQGRSPCTRPVRPLTTKR